MAEVRLNVGDFPYPGVGKVAIEAATDEAIVGLSSHTLRFFRQSTKIYKHPTGRYKGSVVQIKTADSTTITDGGVAYGPWLEFGGRGFAGYALWRKAYQELISVSRRSTEDEIRQSVKKSMGK